MIFATGDCHRDFKRLRIQLIKTKAEKSAAVDCHIFLCPKQAHQHQKDETDKSVNCWLEAIDALLCNN